MSENISEYFKNGLNVLKRLKKVLDFFSSSEKCMNRDSVNLTTAGEFLDEAK